jgi:cell division inhibitor SulA/protein ImuA
MPASAFASFHPAAPVVTFPALAGLPPSTVLAGRAGQGFVPAAGGARVSLASVPAVFRCGELPPGIAPGIPTGFAGLDAEIPGGGWPVGALTEVLCDTCGAGETSLLLPALRYLTRAADWRGRGLLLIDPPHLPYAPALAEAGIDLDLLAVVRPKTQEDALWAAEQALRSGAAGAVLIWARSVRGTDSAQRYQRLRRLQLAAAAGGGLGIVFSATSAATLSTPAALRLSLSMTAQGRLEVTLVKRRGLAQPKTVAVSPRRLPVPYLAGVPSGRPAADAAAAAAAAAPAAAAGVVPASGPLARSMSAVRAVAARLTRERDFHPAR